MAICPDARCRVLAAGFNQSGPLQNYAALSRTWVRGIHMAAKHGSQKGSFCENANSSQSCLICLSVYKGSEKRDSHNSAKRPFLERENRPSHRRLTNHPGRWTVPFVTKSKTIHPSTHRFCRSTIDIERASGTRKDSKEHHSEFFSSLLERMDIERRARRRPLLALLCDTYE
jgi:hypothetical protein